MFHAGNPPGIHSGMARLGRLLASNMENVMGQNGLRQIANTEDFFLTHLELVGLTLAANGYHGSKIATRLHVSNKEIETVLFCAEQKLGAKNRLHAVAIAASQGLIGIEV